MYDEYEYRGKACWIWGIGPSFLIRSDMLEGALVGEGGEWISSRIVFGKPLYFSSYEDALAFIVADSSPRTKRPRIHCPLF